MRTQWMVLSAPINNPSDAEPLLVHKSIVLLASCTPSMTPAARGVVPELTDTRSARAKQILPRGFVLWAWDADPEYDEKAGERWLVLLPGKWNKQVQYAWRFDPCAS